MTTRASLLLVVVVGALLRAASSAAVPSVTSSSARASGSEFAGLLPPGGIVDGDELERAARDATVWVPQAVRGPLSPDDVRSSPPYVPANVPETTGPVRVGPSSALALRLRALDVRRVVADDASARLRFGRVVLDEAADVVDVANAGHVLVEADAVAALPGHHALVEPPGSGAAWVVWADRPVDVVVERAVVQPGRLVWEVVDEAIARWIDEGGSLPALPSGDDSDALAQALLVDRDIGGAIIASAPADPALAEAVRAWRAARALSRLHLVRPWALPYFTVTPLVVDAGGSEQERLGVDDADEPWTRWDTPRTIELDLQGPGMLQLEARALDPSSSAVTTAEVAPSPSGAVRAFSLARADVPEPARVRLVGPFRRARVPSSPSASRAFPDTIELRTQRGAFVGERQQLRMPLVPGRHRYSVVVDGGPALVRLKLARWRPRTMRAFDGVQGPDDLAFRAHGALARSPSPARSVLQALLAPFSVPAHAPLPASSTSRMPTLLQAIAAVARLDQTTDAALVTAAARSVSEACPPPESSTTCWSLRLDVAERLARDGRVAEAIALVSGVGALPPAVWLSRLSALLPAAENDVFDKGDALRAALLGWRAHPLQTRARDAAVRAWFDTTTWQRLRPAAPPSLPVSSAPPASAADGPTSLSSTWLEPREPSMRSFARAGEEATPGDDQAALSTLSAGNVARVLAPASPLDPTARAILRLYVHTDAEAPGPVRVVVDDIPFELLALRPIELVELAVAPGPHDVLVDGPAGTRAFTTAGVLDGSARGATRAPDMRLRRAWPVTTSAKGATRFALPATSDDHHVRVELRRAQAGERPGPIVVTLHADNGWTRALRFVSPVDADAALPVDAAAAATRAVVAEFEVPAGVREVWCTAVDARAALFVSLLTRVARPRAVVEASTARSTSTAPVPVAAPAVSVEDTIARIAQLGARLTVAPDDRGALLERAQALSSLGQPGLARQDVARALRTPSADRAERDALQRAIAALSDDAAQTHLIAPPEAAASPPATGRVEPLGVTLVPPGLLSPWLHVARAARVAGPRAALALVPSVRGEAQVTSAIDIAAPGTLRARLLEGGGDEAGAAAELTALVALGYAPALGAALRCVAMANTAGQGVPDGTLPLLYGFGAGGAAGLRSDARVRRGLGVTTTRTAWEQVQGVERSAGVERLIVRGEPDDGAWSRLRNALAGAPWEAADGHLLSAGAQATLRLQAASTTAVRTQLSCRSIEARDDHAGPCVAVVRVDGATERRIDVAAGGVVDVDSAALAAGRHQLDVLLDGEAGARVLSVRFLSRTVPGPVAGEAARARAASEPGGGAAWTLVPQEHTTAAFVARRGDEVATTVVGPATVLVQARGAQDGAARRATVTTTPSCARGDASPPTVTTLALPDEPALDARGVPDRPLALRAPASVALPLPRACPYRVVVAADDGVVVVQLARRVTRAQPPSPPLPPLVLPVVLPQADGSSPERWDWPPAATATTTTTTTTRLQGLVVDHGRMPVPATSGTTSVGALSSFDGGDEVDVPDPRARFGGLVAHRRALEPGRLWLRGEAAVRWTSPTFGSAGPQASQGRPAPPDAQAGPGTVATALTLEVFAQRLPLDLRVDGIVTAAAAFDRSFLWATSGRVVVDRLVPVASGWQIVPALRADIIHQSANDAADVGRAAREPWVYQGLLADHPVTLSPRLAARFVHLQDQLATAALSSTLNSDFVSLDRVEAPLVWTARLPLSALALPVVRASYTPSLRFGDDDRARTFLRHELTLSGAWTLLVDDGRWLLGPWARATSTPGGGARVEGGVSVRFDAAGRRGLGDVLPLEQLFDDHVGGVLYGSGTQP